MSTLELIQKLRTQTGVGVLDVKKALDEAGGDAEKAVEILRKRGETAALKKSSRIANEGVIASYVHMGKIGVLVELNCETDFVARTDDFQQLGKELAMQVASMQPLYVKPEDVPEDVVAKEKEIYRAHVPADKPDAVQAQIVTGKLEKFYEATCLLRQPYFRDEKMRIGDLLTKSIGKLGENIQVRRFVRFSLQDDHDAASS